MLNNIGESEQFRLVLGLKKKAFGLLPLIMILAARIFFFFFVDVLYQMREFPSISVVLNQE